MRKPRAASPVSQATLDAWKAERERLESQGAKIIRFRIVGDAMAPDYTDGISVELETIDMAQAEPGRDYAIFRRGWPPIFRRLMSAKGEILTLACTNQERYPGVERVDKKLVTQIARVTWRLMPVPSGSPSAVEALLAQATTHEGKVHAEDTRQ